MKKILPLTAILALGLAGTSLAQPESHHNDLELTGKVVAVQKVDLGDAGDTLGDQQIISMDVYAGPKRIGESHVVCTLVRVEPGLTTSRCDNITSLPNGQITASGLVTSAQEETTPFVQAITGGTGAFKLAHGQLTVSEAGPQPATLTFGLS